ncbi:MAG: ABC transporter permease subunit [Coriobacteriia bacterium]|nr:ABC transporter permease subunit [Coriobacteriia bacterium]
MNVFLRELKSHRWGLLFWSIGIVVMVYSGMAKFAAYDAAGQSVVEIMDELPTAIRVIFGLEGFDLTTALGFYGILFLYLAVMGAVHAVLLGSQLIAKEERDRTSEFLFAKPASRNRVITGKLSAGLVMVIAFNLVTLASSLYFVDYFSTDEAFAEEMLVLMTGLLFVQLIFFSIGALVAGTSHRPKAAASRATSIMFFTYLLYYAVNLNESWGFLGYFTPFKYFDAAALIADGLDPFFIGLSAIIIGVAVFGTYRFYSARDLTI